MSVRDRAARWAMRAHDENGGAPFTHGQVASMMEAFANSELHELRDKHQRLQLEQSFEQENRMREQQNKRAGEWR